MKKVLFIARNDRATIQRYLYIVNELKTFGVYPLFLKCEEGIENIIAQEMAELQLSLDYQIISLESFKPDFSIWERVLQRIKMLVRQKESYLTKNDPPLFNAKSKGLFCKGTMSLSSLVAKLCFNVDYVIKKEIDSFMPYFMNTILQVRYLIKVNCPAAVVYDIEFLSIILAVIYEASKTFIPVFSLQHSDGYCQQYSEFPILADYYFAYSKHNYSVLQKMGVKPERILFTGLPIPNATSMAGYLKSRQINLFRDLQLDSEKKIILIALKPSELNIFKYYRNNNIELIRALAEVFYEDDEHIFLLRPHPGDRSFLDPEIDKIICSSNLNVKNTGTQLPIEELMSTSDYVVTFTSSIIVKAILSGIPTCVIIDESGGVWPEWGKYNVFTTIEMGSLKQFFKSLKEGLWPANAGFSDVDRRRFIDEFVPRREPKNAERIANEIFRVINSKTTDKN